MEKSSFKNNIHKKNTFNNIFLVISENYFSTIRVFLYITIIPVITLSTTVASVDHAAVRVFAQAFSKKACGQTFFEKVCGTSDSFSLKADSFSVLLSSSRLARKELERIRTQPSRVSVDIGSFKRR